MLLVSNLFFFTLELGGGVPEEVLNADTLLLGDSGGKTESLDGATNTDTVE